EIVVEPDRVAFDLGDPVDRAGGGQREKVEAVYLGLRPRLQGSELVLAFEGIDGAVPAPAQDDVARRRPDTSLVGGLFYEGADGSGALGHPRAAVEQLGGLAKRRVVELDRGAAQFTQPVDRLRVEAGVVLVAEELGILFA